MTDGLGGLQPKAPNISLQKAGVKVGVGVDQLTPENLNLVEGSNISINAVEDIANSRYDVAISGSDDEAVWGSITGTLSNQTDLSLALDNKVPYTGATGPVDLGANNFTVDTNVLFVDATNNRVGLGTITPAERLELASGNIGLANNTSLKFKNAAGNYIGTQCGVLMTSANQIRTGYSSTYIIHQVDAFPYIDMVIPSPGGSAGTMFRSTAGTTTASSGNTIGWSHQTTVNQSGTASYVDFLINRTQTAVGSGDQRLFDLRVANSSVVHVTNTGRLSIGVASPSANLHIKAGTATASTAPLKFTSGVNLTTPEAGVMEYDGTGLFFTPTSVRRFVDLTSDPKTSTTTVANTVTETTIYSVVVPANEFRAGAMISIEAYGFFSTANASDTFTMRLKKGSTTILSVISTPKNVTNGAFHTKGAFTIRTVGAGGTAIAYMMTELDNEAKSTSETTTSSIDTTASNTYSITIQWTNADANNTLSCTQGVANFLGG